MCCGCVRSYVKALLGGYLLWPLAGVLNFALLPNEYRLLFNNCVNILWTCFLSMVRRSPPGAKPTARSWVSELFRLTCRLSPSCPALCAAIADVQRGRRSRS